MVKLFSPLQIGNTTLKNRIVMSPMCMYSSTNEDGQLTPFHYTHYVSRAFGQVGLIMIEATSVLPEGRISIHDLGLWNDQQIAPLKKLTKEIHQAGSKVAIQLAHAGRKADLSTDIFAPSSLAFDETYQRPHEMSTRDIKDVIKAFELAAKRAIQANFDIIEIHAAHGYLINQFLSPLSNKRTDQYGGNNKNRYQFLKEVIHSVKSIWRERPLFVRISTDEYNNRGNNMKDILYFSSEMKKQGVHLIDCSSGGVVPAKVDVFPGYQVRNCELIKTKTNILSGAVGLITSGLQAEEILQNHRADLIFIGRSLLKNPYWAVSAAEELNYALEAPRQYKRGW